MKNKLISASSLGYMKTNFVAMILLDVFNKYCRHIDQHNVAG